jgi:pimeloyl-ACP methyl ester carboxylesterase
MFSDIAAFATNTRPIFFDYDQHEGINSTCSSITDNIAKLTEIFNDNRAAHPDAIIDIVGHSQGALVAAAAKLPARRTILICPPTTPLIITYQASAAAAGQPLDMSKPYVIARRSGTYTIMNPDYWDKYLKEDPTQYYVPRSDTELFVITADQDDFVPTPLPPLDPSIKVFPLHGDHNFTGDYRKALHETITTLLADE